MTSADPASARWATNPRVIDVSSSAIRLGVCRGVERPGRLPPSHRVGKQLAQTGVGGAGGRLELGIALGVAPAVERDEQAVDVALLVPAEADDGAQHLLDELGERRRLGIGEDRREVLGHRGRPFGHDGVDDLVLALEVAVDGTGRQAGAGDDHLHRHGFEAVLLQAGACRFEDLLAPGLPALVGDPGHATTVPQTKRIFPLDSPVRPLLQNEYSFVIGGATMRTHVRTGSQQVNLSIVTAVVCIALGAVSAAMASLNVAIPDLVRSTHASQTQLEWIIDAYLLVFSVLLLPAGALGDRYGRRKALIGGLVVFGGASAAAMAVSSANDLIFLRGLIGLGAAFVMPATLSTITGTFPPAERTKAVGVWAAVAGGSAILGLLCSGVLLHWFSWRAAFAVNVVLAVVALAGTVRFVPESSQPDAPALDKGGALLATVGLVALVFSIIEAPDAGWLSARTLGGMAAGLAALGGFVLFERRQRHPLLDPRLFSNRKLSAGSLSICIQFFAFFGFTFVSLQYLEGVRGYSPLVAALAVLPLSAAMMPAARLTAGLGVPIRRPHRVRHRAPSRRRRARDHLAGRDRHLRTC